MSEKFGNYFLPKASPQGGPAAPRTSFGHSPMRVNPPERKQVFSKVFSWRLPDGQARRPDAVEVAGTFTQWQKVPLTQNGDPNAWQVMLKEIPAHRTHRYMILVDGQPAYDPSNDGLAIPNGPEEARHQIMTDRGPRVFMLFAQSK